MDTIKEPQEEMILLRINGRKIQVSEHCFPVPPVGGTKQNCPVERYLFAEARFKRPPKKDDTENSTARHFDINYTY